MQDVLNNELELSNHARFLKKHGLYSAALYYKNLNETIERRVARSTRYHFESMPVPQYCDGQRLAVRVPYGIYQKAPEDDMNHYGLVVSVDGGLWFNEEQFSKLYEKCENSVEHNIVESVIRNSRAMHADPSRCRYNHGGVHNVPDFEFVIKNGVLAYREQAQQVISSTDDPEVRQFSEGMLDIIAGIEAYIGRYIASLEQLESTFDGDKERLRHLINALKRVPLAPARSFYEAFVSCNMVMLFSEGFEPGRIDKYLYPYYQKDLENGSITYDEAYSLIRELLEELDARNAHPGVTHATIGGTCADGTPAYNELTEIVIRAVGGLRCPNLTLRVSKAMPQNIWDAVLENLGKGYAQPALVNEEQFLERLTTDYKIPFEDAVDYVFGGCSELLIQGKTMVDSTWVAYNMLDIFEHTLYNHFLQCDTFEEFYRRVKEDYRLTIKEMTEQINIQQFAMAINYPDILRSLFSADCIKNGMSYTKGGTRYNFDSTNIYASTNAINSLFTVKQYYQGKLGNFSKEEFLQSLIANFKGYETLHTKFKNVTKFGNYDPELNALATDLMGFVFTEVMKYDCYRSNPNYTGRFMPAIILWITWVACGRRCGATPDGRLLGEVTANSCGAMTGTDTEGPTSLMGAALSLGQEKCIGTCVLNLRLDSALFKTEESVKKVQMLLQTYFNQGGNQLQVNVVDPELLQQAMEDPENHKDIIVRVGGFSDNFVLLDKAIQQDVLERTRHTM